MLAHVLRDLCQGLTSGQGLINVLFSSLQVVLLEPSPGPFVACRCQFSPFGIITEGRYRVLCLGLGGRGVCESGDILLLLYLQAESVSSSPCECRHIATSPESERTQQRK
jgi:hypothetical protein